MINGEIVIVQLLSSLFKFKKNAYILAPFVSSRFIQVDSSKQVAILSLDVKVVNKDSKAYTHSGTMLTNIMLSFLNWHIIKRDKCIQHQYYLNACSILINLILIITQGACLVPSVMSNSLQPYGLYPARLLCPWDSPGKNTGMGCQALLQGIFLTQGSKLGHLHLLHCRWNLYCWSTTEAHNPRRWVLIWSYFTDG